MCGIVGILSLSGAAVDPAVLQRMNDRQAHRGPDGEGYLFGWIEDGRPAQAFLRHTAAWDGRAAVRVALGHRRLAILDLSERGIQPMAAGGVWILPANARLSEFEEVAARTIGPERALARALDPVRDAFDFVILDCPPRADGVLTRNALRASTTAVLVVETGAFSLQGAIQARRILAEAREKDQLGFGLRVLATMFDRRLKLAREILVALQARFGRSLYDTVIRESARLREAAAVGEPVQVLDPASRSTADFAALAEEILAAGTRAGSGRAEAVEGPPALAT